MMTLEELRAVRDALSDCIRIINDLSDALRAVSVAAQMGTEALERVEVDLLAVVDLTEH